MAVCWVVLCCTGRSIDAAWEGLSLGRVYICAALAANEMIDCRVVISDFRAQWFSAFESGHCSTFEYLLHANGYIFLPMQVL